MPRTSQFKRFTRFRLASLMAITTVVAIWFAATVRPLQYLRDAERIRDLGGRVALRDTELGFRGVPYRLYCRFTNRSAELPAILVLDERCPKSAPVLKIAGRIPTLMSLDLTRSDLDDASFAYLKRLRNVQHLRVQGRPITDVSMSIVARYNDLRSASFQGTMITDAGVEQLSACVKLEELSLRGTRLTDHSVDHLASLYRLQRLDVSRCGLSVGAVERLRTALPGCEVEVRDF